MGILTPSNSINIPFSIDFLVSIIRFFTSRNLFHPYPHQHFAFRISFLVHISNFSFISFNIMFFFMLLFYIVSHQSSILCLCKFGTPSCLCCLSLMGPCFLACFIIVDTKSLIFLGILPPGGL